MLNAFIFAGIFSLLPNKLQVVVRFIWTVVLVLVILYLIRAGFFGTFYQDVLTPLGHVLSKLFGNLGDTVYYTLTGDCPKQYSTCKMPI